MFVPHLPQLAGNLLRRPAPADVGEGKAAQGGPLGQPDHAAPPPRACAPRGEGRVIIGPAAPVARNLPRDRRRRAAQCTRDDALAMPLVQARLEEVVLAGAQMPVMLSQQTPVKSVGVALQM